MNAMMKRQRVGRHTTSGSYLSPTTALLVVMAFLLGIGPYAVMFWYQDGGGGGGGDANSRSFASPSMLLRRRMGRSSQGLASRQGAFDEMRAEYEKMVEAEAKVKKAKHAKQLHRGDDDHRARQLRAIEAERRRNGYPPIQQQQHHQDGPVPVQIIPTNEGTEQAPSSSRLSSLLNEGIASSPRLARATSSYEDGVVWIVDLSRIMCHELVDEADRTMKKRIEEHRRAVNSGLPSPFGHLPSPSSSHAAASARLTSALQWKIYIIDFSDYGYVAEDDVYYGIDDFTLDCIKPLSDLIGRRNVHFASREHVLGRNVRPAGTSGGDEEPFGPLGDVIDYGKMHLIHFMMGKVRRIDFGYRTLLERCLEDEAAKLATTPSSREAPGMLAENPSIDLSSLSRPNDVAHFWKVGNDDNHTSAIRDAVNDVVRSLGNADDVGEDTDQSPPATRVYAKHFGDGMGSFKSINVTCPLAREMLRYKILVVAQKDKYEGHYRLMDALLSGALVMTDPMSRLPLFLEDKTNVVVYRSPAELRRLLQYYLEREHENERIAIGKRGREIALRHHSPAAWVERIIFGNWNNTMGE